MELLFHGDGNDLRSPSGNANDQLQFGRGPMPKTVAATKRPRNRQQDGKLSDVLKDCPFVMWNQINACLS